MERHLAGQEKAMVEVSMEQDYRPGGSPARCCHYRTCAAALAAVLVTVAVAVLVGFLSTCNQHPVQGIPCKAPARFTFTCPPNDGIEQDRFVIATVNKFATYLIQGEVKSGASMEVTLERVHKNHTIIIAMKHEREGYVLYLDEARLSNDTRITVYIKSPSPVSCNFSIYEL